ncbi:hypothetical protein [Massilia sp. CF038]|uniref:hypothetical protein n=1 Tax=Massilia sp. CF038 TaxID=1881045 RepID=UPI0011612CA7|nr:hypothetical protein [Massilia sp. CF038]
MPTKQQGGETLPAPELAGAMQPPDSLETSVETVQDTMRQYLWESMAVDGRSADLSNFLIALTTFGLYKGVTHPTTANIAAAAAVGSAAYAYGTSNKLSARAGAYTDGFRRLNCSLSAASTYRIMSSEDDKDNSGTTTLARAIKMNQYALASLDSDIDALRPYDIVLVKKPASQARSVCPWQGKLWSKDANRACNVAAQAAVKQAPPPQVSAALSRASELAVEMRASLKRASTIYAASRGMGVRLWENSNFIVSNTSDLVRGTIADPLDAIARAKSFMAQQTQAPGTSALAPAPAQQAQSNRATPVANSARELELYSPEADALMALNKSLRAARWRHQQLQSILDQNTMPPLSFEQIDRCRSSADEVVQGIALAATKNVTPAAPVVSAPKDNQATPLPDADAQIWNGLDFPGQPTLGDLASRIEQCQQHLGVAPNARRWDAIADVITAGKCKGLPWK